MKDFSLDPFPAATPDPASGYWIYGRAERETFRQQMMIRAKDEAALKVGYPGEFMTPHRTIHFRAMLPAGVFPVNCIGTPELTEICMESPGMFEFTLSVPDIEKDVPCFKCDGNFHWESSFDGKEWHDASKAAGNEIPPHRMELPCAEIIARKMPDGIYDSGREVFGWVTIRNAANARLFVGESIPEALNRDPEHFEQRTDLIAADPGILRSAVPLALRYLTLENADENADVRIEAIHTPMTLKKSFSCGDRELDEIWQRSIYTLRLCTCHFMIDGVKRDRLPWAGDLAVSLLSMVHSYQQPEPIRDTLAVLGSAGIRNEHINGIMDYSLWYLINFDLYEKYFDDPEFLHQEYFRIVETADILLKQSENGLLPVSGWVLIDWADGDKNCALQILFFMALKALANLARRMDDRENEEKWETLAIELQKKIRREFYDEKRGLFRCSPGKDEFLRHQNFLAAISLAAPEEGRRIAGNLLKNELPAVGTPYMKSFEILALIRNGFKAEAAEEIRRFWGGMMHAGATTFFEAFGEGKSGSGLYDFYGRPFGLSLCHAWSSAPAFLLPMIFENDN